MVWFQSPKDVEELLELGISGEQCLLRDKLSCRIYETMELISGYSSKQNFN